MQRSGKVANIYTILDLLFKKNNFLHLLRYLKAELKYFKLLLIKMRPEIKISGSET